MDYLEDLHGSRKEEYQLQHFGFTSSTFKIEVKEMVMAVIEEAVGALEKSLLEQFPRCKTDEMISASRKLVEEYANKTEEWITSIEEKLDNHFFHIPNNVLLTEDKPQIKQYTVEEEKIIDQDIKDLEKKLIKAKFMEAKLREAVKLSEKALKQHLNFTVESTGITSTNDLIKGLDKMQRKTMKVNEDGNNILQMPLMKNSNSFDVSEENCGKEECQLKEIIFKKQVH